MPSANSTATTTGKLFSVVVAVVAMMSLLSSRWRPVVAFRPVVTTKPSRCSTTCPVVPSSRNHNRLSLFLPFSSSSRRNNSDMYYRRYYCASSKILLTAQKNEGDNDDDDNNNHQQQQQQQQSSSSTTTPRHPQPLENIYTEWSLEDDRLLWENRKESLADLAALLGRGLKGVEARLCKLRDVDSPAYERFFSKKSTMTATTTTSEKKKLVPVSEVLRRIQWDYSLSPSDFSVLYYDRVEDTVVESRLDAPNDSIQGNRKLLIDALPEHRILYVKYKEQVVWDREKRLDRVFSSSGGEGIEDVIENYDAWKRNKDANEEWLQQRQTQVATKVRHILGVDRYSLFKTISNQLQSALDDPSLSNKREAEQYVEASLDLFRQVLNDPSAGSLVGVDPIFIPRSDIEAVECLSELVALSRNVQLRQHVLAELALVLNRLEGDNHQHPQQIIMAQAGATAANVAAVALMNQELPEMSESDITETFVRGSGPGGQKINKTNNKVVLVHNPTQLRVECQDTRSLQQNRKIARKRLRLKLDDFLNGSQSRASIKAEKASTKKAKAKARSRARNRKKAAEKEESSSSDKQIIS